MAEGCYVIYWDTFSADGVAERHTVTHVQCHKEEKPEVILARVEITIKDAISAPIIMCVQCKESL